MELTSELARAYSRQIYGYAYSKTRNVREAEDLSQEILLTLCQCLRREQTAERMEAYVGRVCRFCWMNALRRRQRDADHTLHSEEILGSLEAPDCPEEELARDETYRRLRREIAYLGKTRREALTAFYYDRLPGGEIARRLGVPHATVRWHLRQAKQELKERLMMEENRKPYIPVRLRIGHSGYYNNGTYQTLQSDLLMQNILWLTRTEAKTIEDLARELSVAAVYLEDKVAALLKMEYLSRTGGGKLRCNSFVQDVPYQLACQRFRLEHTPPIADKLHETVRAALPQLRAIGFLGSDLDPAELAWHFLLLMMDVFGEVDEEMIRHRHWEHGSPLRPDGSRHWLGLGSRAEDVIAAIPPEETALRDFCETGGAAGISTNETDADAGIRVHSLTANLNLFGGGRAITGRQLQTFRRASELIRAGESPNDFEKLAIAEAAKEGWIEVEGGRPRFLIPYLTAAELAACKEILARQAAERLRTEDLLPVFLRYADETERLVPPHISENERRHLRTSYDPQLMVFWLLRRAGQLTTPTPERKKRLCILVWEVA
ncbi:MAG: sigma-70 family RNA polymerase sigma factor [Oscillospiraceae bacterium]|nr:sigma-70 family RNA polymerase sigma factor [Oscillospiraceae bacterium]